jgi:hypothetical protein
MSIERARVALIEQDGQSILDSWTDLLELVRDARGGFTVMAWKHVAEHGKSNRKWRLWSKSSRVKDPLETMQAIEAEAEMLGHSIDWVDAIPKVASIDWLGAAIIAKLNDQDLPPLPPADAFAAQRALKKFGRVRIDLEWGYEDHELLLSFEQWIRILGGEQWSARTRFDYEGESMSAAWSFDGAGNLEVTYRGGGVGWTGSLEHLDSLVGPTVDGIDVAALALDALLAARGVTAR